jgi:hypothetical protein
LPDGARSLPHGTVIHRADLANLYLGTRLVSPSVSRAESAIRDKFCLKMW